MIYFALPFLLNPLLKHIRLLNNYWFQKLKLNIYLFIKKILPSSPLNKLKFCPAKKSLLHLIVIRKLDDLLLKAVEKIRSPRELLEGRSLTQWTKRPSCMITD